MMLGKADADSLRCTKRLRLMTSLRRPLVRRLHSLLR